MKQKLPFEWWQPVALVASLGVIGLAYSLDPNRSPWTLVVLGVMIAGSLLVLRIGAKRRVEDEKQAVIKRAYDDDLRTGRVPPNTPLPRRVRQA